MPMFIFVRFLVIFVIGVAAGIAWQSYGNAARGAIAGWSTHLAWLAPPAEPAGAFSDQVVALSRDLNVVRQGVDKLAADVSKLATLQQGDRDKTSVSQASVRKPGAGR
jgi:phosphotransferase system  glucose/maltose/N-acetylglucosamine-specific IIC component